MSDQPTTQSNAGDEFYVGYLPTPPRHLKLIKRVVWVLLIWIIGSGVFIAFNMREPGDAVWNTADMQTVSGIIELEPYPMLIPDDGTEPYLLVEMGKLGAHDRLHGLEGGFLREVQGYLLSRDGRRIIELTPGDAGLLPASKLEPEGTRDTSVEVIGPFDETAEIIDGKCYLGAMKPGDGMTHKACATLCIRGGLPPMVLTHRNGVPEFHLLIVDGSTELSDDLIELVAEPVRVTGELVDIAGMSAVRTTSAGITRIP